MSPANGAPIVVFGDDWGRHVSSMQHLFRPIVRRRPVVWINGVGHRVPSLRAADLRRAVEKGRSMFRRTHDAGSIPRHETSPAAVIEPHVLPWHHVGAIHRLNTMTLVRIVRRTLDRLGLHEPPVLVTGSPPTVGVVGRLGERAAVYFCMDDFLHLAGVSSWMLAPLERRLLGVVDVVVATAEELVRVKRPRRGTVQYLPQGVNYEHFAIRRPVPPDLAHLPAPRIGFAGGLSPCCDVPLIRRLAEAFPRASLVFVGPVSIDVGELRLPNVHFLGPRPYAELPGYVQHFDVGIIPYLLNDWTRAVDPLKLLEYLAAGVPVVTTNLPEVRKYADAVLMGATAGEFVHLVASALASDRSASQKKGQALARQHTWERRADTFLHLLDSLGPGTASTPLHR